MGHVRLIYLEIPISKLLGRYQQSRFGLGALSDALSFGTEKIYSVVCALKLFVWMSALRVSARFPPIALAELPCFVASRAAHPSHSRVVLARMSSFEVARLACCRYLVRPFPATIAAIPDSRGDLTCAE